MEKFCEAKHPEALALRDARKLAEAVRLHKTLRVTQPWRRT